MDNTKTSIIKTENLNKSFHVVSGEVQVLKNINIEIKQGEFTIIYGPSGSGKSTLLHTILGLEKPTSGKVLVLNRNIYEEYSEDALADFRKNNIGMVFQQANWVKSLNVEENVVLPLVMLGENKILGIEKARKLLNEINMLEWAQYYPSELSSGQQQKVSLARALITNPRIIIADEPTGNLDFESSEELVYMLIRARKDQGKTVLMVTHDLTYLKYADTCIRLFDGKIDKVFSPRTEPKEVENIKIRTKRYEGDIFKN